MIALPLAAAVAQAVMPVAIPPAPVADPCAATVVAGAARARAGAGAGTGARKRRAMTTRDLAGLVDIGRSDPNDAPSPFGLSPDGRWIAFVERQANPDANGYCQRLMVKAVSGEGSAREIDRGGEFIRDTFVLRNFTAVAAGWAKVVTPRWSPDGRSVAFLKRVNGSTQVWLADADGSGRGRQATDLPDDVVEFAWAIDGVGLVVATRPALRRQAEAIGREAAGGFLFDDRFAPQFADHPLPTGPAALEYAAWDIAARKGRAATPDEAAKIASPRPDRVPASARGFVSGAGRALAWTEPAHPEQLLSPSRLVAFDNDGMRAVCEAACAGVSRMWWSADGRTLSLLQRTGWANSRTALLAWRLSEKSPRRVMVTDDSLIGCAMPAGEIVCARESATRPRRLVALHPLSGRERLIHDPNPGFAQLETGHAQRFHVRNEFGVESYADLVLPPGHRPGERHPLVVVQYISDGFLRGGTDDEFPIQALAGKGFAVLSFSRPDFVPAALEATSELAMRQANRRDWIDRRSVQSSLETAVRMAVATGAVDPDRMGISGFSDGSSTVQFALINSGLFKVAAMGACCEDMQSYPLASGPAFERFGREMGYRFFEAGAQEFWKPMSLVLNADRVKAPILIQTGDSEYENGLDVVAAFRLRGNPIELYVLDQEGHFKVQPAHRLAIYDRSLEWFEFWLMGRMNCDPAKTEQFARWKAMRGAPADAVCEAGP